MIEIITSKDIESMYLETEDGTFTPMYEYESYDSETETYQGFKVIKTAEEAYQEWLYNKENPPTEELTDVEVLQEENKLLKAQVEALNATTDFHEELIAEMAMILYA